MKIIRPSVVVMEHNLPPYQFIERVGRTCYKSEDKITGESAEKFVEGLVNRDHWAMLEHETLFLVIKEKRFMNEFMGVMAGREDDLKYFNITDEEVSVISGSFRAFHDLFSKNEAVINSSLYRIRNIICSAYPIVFGKPSPNFDPFSLSRTVCSLYSRREFIETFSHRKDILFKHLTHTLKFVCDRGVSHEFVRHRPASFAQESTRYCNYSLDKFGDEITVIQPLFFGNDNVESYQTWEFAMSVAEKCYFDLLDRGHTPQEARSVLPNSLKTELIITATEEEWQHIVNLRYIGTTGVPHPQMKEVMRMAVIMLKYESEERICYEAN